MIKINEDTKKFDNFQATYWQPNYILEILLLPNNFLWPMAPWTMELSSGTSHDMYEWVTAKIDAIICILNPNVQSLVSRS